MVIGGHDVSGRCSSLEIVMFPELSSIGRYIFCGLSANNVGRLSSHHALPDSAGFVQGDVLSTPLFWFLVSSALVNSIFLQQWGMVSLSICWRNSEVTLTGDNLVKRK